MNNWNFTSSFSRYKEGFCSLVDWESNTIEEEKDSISLSLCCLWFFIDILPPFSTMFNLFLYIIISTPFAHNIKDDWLFFFKIAITAFYHKLSKMVEDFFFKISFQYQVEKVIGSRGHLLWRTLLISAQDTKNHLICE